jgi:uncharacterized protein
LEPELQTSKQHPLQLNVGFLVHQSVGTSHDSEFDFPAIQVGDDLRLTFLRGSLRFTRTSEGLYLEGKLASAMELECNRCLTAIDNQLAVELGDLLRYPSTDPVLGVPETGILDLRPLVREHFLLGIPSQPLCREGCRGLCPECGGNLNESSCTHPEAEVDPRLAALKSLLHES